jgi:predicted flap endonuclease-1-like 5' DNA nuclease
MPELTFPHIVILAALILLAAIAGWLLRSKRSKLEKAAINASWQQQIGAQRTEHERLAEQNKSLMEQVGQYQASNQDAKNRARELSGAVQEAYTRRDKLQREIKDVRSNLEAAMTAREQLQSDIEAGNKDLREARSKAALITKLQSELQKWQDRVPPLVERFQRRDDEASQLETGLAEAQQRIAELEAGASSQQTRIEPVNDPDLLTDGRSASNDTLDLDVTAAGDELQRIKGIGPAIQKTLNEIGIFSFQQIADMTEYDIDQVAKRLKGFHSRIYREDWIGQARDLHSQGIVGATPP